MYHLPSIFVLFVAFLNLASGAKTAAVIRWCTLGRQEYDKCEDFRDAVKTMAFAEYEITLACVQGKTKFACWEKISKLEADLMTLEAGDLYYAGRHFSIIPIMREQYDKNQGQGFQPTKQTRTPYRSVAVVRKDSGIKSIKDLKGKKSCHAGAGNAAGWIMPISYLLKNGTLEVHDCNNPVKSSAKFFKTSCIPDALDELFSPSGDNPLSAIGNCKAPKGVQLSADHGTTLNEYAGDAGALLKCLIRDRAADVAFVSDRMLDNIIDPENYELICPYEGTASLAGAMKCNFGYVNSKAVVTTSRHLGEEGANKRKLFITFLNDLQARYGSFDGGFSNATAGMKPKTSFKMFDSSTYTDGTASGSGGRGYDLLFSDKTYRLVEVDEGESTYRVYLGDEFMKKVQMLKKCPVRRLRICLNSEPEMFKCNNMKETFDGKNIKPGLLCLKAFDPAECMHRIRDNTADVAMLDSADVYMAGRYYGLVPIASEEYVTNDTFYAVAVAKKKDPDTTMLNLRAKRACMGAIGTEAGWTLPVQTILSTYQAYRGMFFREKCDVIKLIGEFFSTSCVPGALSPAYNGKLQNPRMMCELCGGDSGGDFCAKNMDEPYYGNTGAFKCLVEKGEVAFTSHRAVLENVEMRNKENWARALRADEFELLCLDGTRMPVTQYKKCNLGEVKGRAMVTARRRNDVDRDIFFNAFNLGQMNFGTGSASEFNMFRSFPRAYADLIFSDSTMKLVQVPKEKQDHRDFLGRNKYLPRIQQMDLTTCAGCKLAFFNAVLAALLAAYMLV